MAPLQSTGQLQSRICYFILCCPHILRRSFLGHSYFTVINLFFPTAPWSSWLQPCSRRPWWLIAINIPLHNNGAENAIREYVKKRKVSGGTRSDSGRQCRDTFTSLKKTCRKLGVSFWHYLKDRIEKTGFIPDLSELIREHALKPG